MAETAARVGAGAGHHLRADRRAALRQGAAALRSLAAGEAARGDAGRGHPHRRRPHQAARWEGRAVIVASSSSPSCWSWRRSPCWCCAGATRTRRLTGSHPRPAASCSRSSATRSRVPRSTPTLRLARAEGATLVPVYLVTVPLHLALEAPLPAKCEHAMPLLEAIEQRAARLHVPVDSRIETGRSPRHALRRALEHGRYDRIVVPAATRTQLRLLRRRTSPGCSSTRPARSWCCGPTRRAMRRATCRPPCSSGRAC